MFQNKELQISVFISAFWFHFFYIDNNALKTRSPSKYTQYRDDNQFNWLVQILLFWQTATKRLVRNHPQVFWGRVRWFQQLMHYGVEMPVTLLQFSKHYSTFSGGVTRISSEVEQYHYKDVHLTSYVLEIRNYRYRFHFFSIDFLQK